MSGAREAEGPRRYETGFRPDIEGLRAIAVLGVLGFHAALPFMPGGYVGVDVFFVISGFLITGLLLADIEKRGRFALTRFYARRARRILPAAGVVLAITSVASALWLSPLRRQDVALDTIAAALNVSNWRFIAQQTDYLAQGRADSPLLHYWSLSVEEQFYLVWAPLVLLIVLVALRLRRSPIGAIALGAGVMTVASFLLCLHWTGTNVPVAYLGSPSRGWQFGVGALGALSVPVVARWLGERRRAALGLGVAGAAAVLWAIVRYDGGTPYPGTAALLPTLGTVAVMLAGAGERSARGFGRVLATPPMRAIGRLSYSWYLWHWPVLVIWEARFGPANWPVKLALVTASAVPAWLTMRLVETPVRLSPRFASTPWRGLAAGAASVALAVGGGLFLNVNATRALNAYNSVQPVAQAGPQGNRPAPAPNQVAVDQGHLFLPPYPVVPPGPPRPSPQQARNDYPGVGDCQISTGSTINGPCLFGDASSTDRIVLLGDSHAMEWFPALEEIARPRGWAIEVLGKAGCPVSTMVIESRNVPDFYRECAAWRDAALNRIAREPKPKMIFVGTLMEQAYVGQTYINAWDDSLNRLRATGAPVVYFRDTPYPGKDIPDCVSGVPIGSDACDFSRSSSVYPDGMANLIGADRRSGVYLIDLTKALCPLQTCPVVIDGILTYQDRSHITATASRILGARVEEQLETYGLVN